MSRWNVDVEKFSNGEYWTNRYILETGGLANAMEGADIIVAREIQFHRESVTFTKVRTSSAVAGDEVYDSRPLTATGQVPDAGPLLPAFNVVRVDFPVEGGGRPSRKYYRVNLCAGDIVVDYRISSSLALLIADEVTSMLAELGGNASPMCDPQSQTVASASVFDIVAMRQLRKGSKRRTEPIL